MRVSPGLMTFIVGLLLLGLAGLWYQQSLIASGLYGGSAPAPGHSAAGAQGRAPSQVKYACPMRCVETDQPGDCPICGMEMRPVASAVDGAGAASGVQGRAPSQVEYTCPMHPQVVRDRPGTCPICGMELVPKTDAPAELAGDIAAAVGEVKLAPGQAVLGNVVPVHAQFEALDLTVPAIGEVQARQDAMKDIVSWQMGRVDNLALDSSGGEIKEGDHILDIYSPDLVQAQGEYLLALKAMNEMGASQYESVASGAKAMLEAARLKLTRLGMSAGQIAALDKSRQVQEHVAITATAGGVVMEKMVSEGMYVDQGMKLFSVADLSSVWVELQVFEQDAAPLTVGDRVSLSSPAYPNKAFSGKVLLIMPEIDMETRTYRVRVAVENPKLLLRPGMILDAKLAVDYGKLLLLPRNAVLHTGDGDLVYVLKGDGAWEPRLVVTGRDFGDKVEILKGLSPEEAVAGTAAFLLDSEAQLRGVPRPVEGGAESAPPEQAHVH